MQLIYFDQFIINTELKIIKKMHLECDDKVKDAYNMEIKENDVYMDWKFSIVTGINPLS